MTLAIGYSVALAVALVMGLRDLRTLRGDARDWKYRRLRNAHRSRRGLH